VHNITLLIHAPSCTYHYNTPPNPMSKVPISLSAICLFSRFQEIATSRARLECLLPDHAHPVKHFLYELNVHFVYGVTILSKNFCILTLGQEGPPVSVWVRVSASLNFMYFVLLNELPVISLVLLMVQYDAAIWCWSANKRRLRSCTPECAILCCAYSHSGV